MTKFFLEPQAEILTHDYIPLYDLLMIYDNVKPNQFFAKVYFNHNNNDKKFVSLVTSLNFGSWSQGLKIQFSIDLVSLDNKQNKNIIYDMTKEKLDQYIETNFLTNINEEFYFPITPENYCHLVNYGYQKIGEIDEELITSIVNSNNNGRNPLRSHSSFSQLNNKGINFSIRSQSSHSQYISSDVHSEIINTLIAHNVIPKKLPSLSVDIKTLDPNLLNRPDSFNILSQIRFFNKQSSYSQSTMEHNVNFIKHINKKLEKEIAKFNPDDKNTLFTKSFIAFCKKQKSHLFSKDLSSFPDFSQFYSNVKTLSQQYPEVEEQISNLTQLFKEKDSGIDFTPLGEYSNNELTVEALILDHQILRSLSSLAIFNKIKSHANNILETVIKNSDYEVILPFSHISKGLYTTVIQKTNINSNQKEIWENFDYVINYFLLNQNNIEYNDKMIQSLIIQKKIEYSLDDIPVQNKPLNVNKF